MPDFNNSGSRANNVLQAWPQSSSTWTVPSKLRGMKISDRISSNLLTTKLADSALLYATDLHLSALRFYLRQRSEKSVYGHRICCWASRCSSRCSCSIGICCRPGCPTLAAHHHHRSTTTCSARVCSSHPVSAVGSCCEGSTALQRPPIFPLKLTTSQ